MHHCLRCMHERGIRPLRCLVHLGIIIGETYFCDGNMNLRAEHMEPDLRITLTEPEGSRRAVLQAVPTLAWGIKRIEAPRAWGSSRGRGVRVAIIDTGIERGHEAIADNYGGGINILSPHAPPMDYNGHGTHVAGIVAGRATEKGLLGVAPRAIVYAVKAFNRGGSAKLSDLLSALNWCIENRMQVINMSFGMETKSTALLQAIATVYKHGSIMVAATGNEGAKDRIDYPARCEETIAVTSFSINGKLSHFSNMGKGIDLAAPGERIVSSWIRSGRREMSGTSMAVPHVTGTVALLLRRFGSFHIEHVRDLLRSATTPLPGSRALNAYNALQLGKRRSYNTWKGSA